MGLTKSGGPWECVFRVRISCCRKSQACLNGSQRPRKTPIHNFSSILIYKLHPRTLFIHPSPPSPSSPCLLLAALRLRGVSGECLSQFGLLSRTHSTSLIQLPNVLSLTSHYFLHHPHLACAYSATFRIAPQQVNARILRIHRIERYPIKSRPYLDVNIFEVL